MEKNELHSYFTVQEIGNDSTLDENKYSEKQFVQRWEFKN
jgi:hypothetical protein